MAIVALVAVFAVVGVGGTVWADLHIVTESSVETPGMPSLPGMDDLFDDDGANEIFFRNNRILMPDGDGTKTLFDCASGEFAIINDEAAVYWSGTVAEMLEEMQEAFGNLDADGMDVSSLMEEMFGAGTEDWAVRVIRVGTETVAGYEAVQYKVEYEENGRWELFENVSVSPELLEKIRAETGDCINTLAREFQMTMAGLTIGESGPMWSVLSSDEYAVVFEEGYPVRQQSIVSTFGMEIHTSTDVTKVSERTLDESMFAIPDDYRKITMLEAISTGN